MSEEDLVEVELSRVVIQEKDDHQFIHLRERDGKRTFPIVIGFNEVAEINRKLRGVEVVRPLTHDLIGRVLESLDATLEKVVISELRDSTFYATLVLRRNGTERLVDCRPSDAICLAVQTQTQIYVSKQVLDQVAPG
ncbi:MAG: bifunctional nuclease family protein [Planctomycetota bacterium]